MNTENFNTTLLEKFSTHKATLIQDTDRFLIIDWKREDGSGDYYVNYIVDKKRGSLIVSGDLGDSIATWYNPIDPSKLKTWIHNDIGYYIGKLQCASDKYTYNAEDVVADIRDHFADYDISVEELIENGTLDFDDEREFWDEIQYEASISTQRDNFTPTTDIINIMESIDIDYWEWLYNCGRRIDNRVYMWAEGFYMACKQLEI